MPIVDRASFDEESGVAWIRWSFACSRPLVWAGLTRGELLRQWLGTPTFDDPPAMGDVVTIDHEGMTQTSRVLSARPEEAFEVTWDFPGEAPSRVAVELADDPRGTDLTLTHTGIPGLARSYGIGWHTHLLYLSGVLRGSPLPLDQFWDVHERVTRAYF